MRRSTRTRTTAAAAAIVQSSNSLSHHQPPGQFHLVSLPDEVVHEVVASVSDGADLDTLVKVSKQLRTAVHQTAKGLTVQDEEDLHAALELVVKCSSMSTLRLRGCIMHSLGLLPRQLHTVELVNCDYLTSLDGMPERLKCFKCIRCVGGGCMRMESHVMSCGARAWLVSAQV
jgi:hypothetical protein